MTQRFHVCDGNRIVATVVAPDAKHAARPFPGARIVPATERGPGSPGPGWTQSDEGAWHPPAPAPAPTTVRERVSGLPPTREKLAEFLAAGVELQRAMRLTRWADHAGPSAEDAAVLDALGAGLSVADAVASAKRKVTP